MLRSQQLYEQSQQQALVTVSEISIHAGRSLGKLLRKLDRIHRFNAVTWFDIFYLVPAALALVLDLRVNDYSHNPKSESRALLRDLASLAARHMENPRMPGSMQALAQIVVDVNRTAEQSSSVSEKEQQADGAESLTDTFNGRAAGMPVSGVSYSPNDPLLSPMEMQLQSHGLEEELLRGHEPDGQLWAQLSFLDDSEGVGQGWNLKQYWSPQQDQLKL